MQYIYKIARTGKRHYGLFFGLLLLAFAIITISAAQPPAKKKNPNAKVPEQKEKEEEHVLSLETTQVMLTVTVTDLEDRYVSGLKPEHFNVSEDKVPQKIVGFGYEETPFSSAILLDTSGSMTPKMSIARSACSRFASGLRLGDSVAIYSFGGMKVKQLQDFSELRDVDPMVWETDAEGETPLYDAIVMASEALGKREDKRRAILLISDGADTRSRATLDQAIRAASDANVMIYAVDLSEAAFGRGPARDNGAAILKEFAERTGGQFFPSPGGSKLRDAFERTIDELRHQYSIVYEPTNDTKDGKWRTVEVSLKDPLLKARTRQGYYGPKPEKKE